MYMHKLIAGTGRASTSTIACSLCGECQFRCKTNYLAHIRLIHSDKPGFLMRCCGHTFNKFASYRNHVYSYHSTLDFTVGDSADTQDEADDTFDPSFGRLEEIAIVDGQVKLVVRELETVHHSWHWNALLVSPKAFNITLISPEDLTYPFPVHLRNVPGLTSVGQMVIVPN